MGTRAAAFTAKIRGLSEFQLRLMQGTVPAPSGVDISNLLKQFNSLLLGVLRDIKSAPVKMVRKREQDEARLALFPSLDYHGLHKAITNLLDLLHLVTFGKHALGTAVLQLLSTLLIFLDRDTIDTFPFLVASMVSTTPETVHPYLLKTLCFHVLPATVGAAPKDGDDEEYVLASVPAVVMLILQYTENSAYHCQLIECLLSVKCNLIQDLIFVIAHGTPASRLPASNLLFYYWPNLNPKLFDRKGANIKLADISCVLKAMFNKPAQAAKADSVSHTGAISEPAVSKTPKGWKALPCQMESCQAEGMAKIMSFVCMDHVAALGACPDMPPPLYMCKRCKEDLEQTQGDVVLENILMPMVNVSTSCENKNCRSSEKNAIATCFSMDCCSYNNYRPVRLCAQCNTIRHSAARGTDDHRVHTAVSCVWDQPPQLQSFIIECVVSLLTEAQPALDKAKSKDSDRVNRTPIMEDTDQCSSGSVEDGRVLSRYGVWLLVGLCTPNEKTPIPVLGRLLGALCHWFTVTHYMTDADQHGVTIERLKSDHLQSWLQELCKTHLDVFVDCLLPHPSEYCRVGGHWETLSPRSEHVQEGFRRLFCLVPYEVITLTVWERVMPHWFEAIHTDVTEEHLNSMRITLSKLLDPEMSPLGFDATQMYRFLVVRFENTSANVQVQNLEWLQMLSSISINVPIYLLLSMFETGVSSFLTEKKESKLSDTVADDDGGSPAKNTSEMEPVPSSGDSSSSGFSEDEDDNPEKDSDEQTSSSDPELVLTCYVLMLDIAYKQMEVQDITKHQGITSGISTAMWQLLNKMLKTPCLISHECAEECNVCFLLNTFFQLCTEILVHLCPKIAIANFRVADIIKGNTEVEKLRNQAAAAMAAAQQAAEADEAAKSAQSTAPAPPTTSSTPPTSTVTTMSGSSSMPQVATATVATVGEMQIAANIPQENIMEATASATTCTEDDGAHATASVVTPSVVGADDTPVDTTMPLEEESDVWVTSQGKFKFKLEDLPAQLQVIFTLLKRLELTTDGDEVYHICLCLKYLVLHGEALAQTAHLHKGFLLWCQEKSTIVTTWSLISSEWSHVAEVCVALLLHCIALPDGADIFWRLCEENFNHNDWKIRFQAVEKVVVLGRFLNIAAVRQCRPLQAAVSHAFCYLITSLDDLNVAVAQEASIGLTSLPDPGLKALVWCLEQQFDWVIMDRPMIIQTIHQLCCCLPERKILTWEFFFNRFDTLYLESQVTLENRGEFFQKPRDLRNSNLNSEVFTRKYSRAQEALNLVQSSSTKTLCSSLGPKCPYKRTMSAPANMLNKIDKTGGGFITGGLSGIVGETAQAGGSDAMMQRLQKVMDLEETDKDTLHLIIFLFMQFLAHPQYAKVVDDKMVETVLRHVAGLMGYSFIDRNFSIVPSKLRASPVFNSFISCLPQVLDHNFEICKKIINIILPVLQYSPATRKMAEFRNLPYSLWMLQPSVRKSWLSSVLTIFYKFDCEEGHLKTQVQTLIQITLNTLERHFHRCRWQHPGTVSASAMHYSREMSQGSVGGDDGGDQSGGDRGDSSATKGSTVSPQHVLQVQVPQVQLTRYSEHEHASCEAIPIAAASISPFGVNILPTTEEVDEKPEQEIWYEAPSELPAPQTDGLQVATALESTENTSDAHTAVTSVMASQILAFDDSFTVRIHNTELSQDSGLQRLSERALENLRSRFASQQRQSLPPSNTPSLPSTPSSGTAPSRVPQSTEGTSIQAPKDLRRIQAHAQFSSSTPKSSGSSQRSSTSYWLSSSTSTDSSCDVNISRAPTKLAFEICIEEDPESWESVDRAESPTEKNVKEYQSSHHKTVEHDLSNHKQCSISRTLKPGTDSKFFDSSCEVSKTSHYANASLTSDMERHCVSSAGVQDNSAAHAVRNLATACSPPSPLSMMDLITVGSPVPIDCSTESPSMDLPSPRLELPTPERLLDRGEMGSSGEEKSIIDKVWQAFGGWRDPGKAIAPEVSGVPCKRTDDNVASVHFAKDSDVKPKHSQIVRKDDYPDNYPHSLSQGKLIPYEVKSTATVVNYRTAASSDSADSEMISSVIETVKIGKDKSHRHAELVPTSSLLLGVSSKSKDGSAGASGAGGSDQNVTVLYDSSDLTQLTRDGAKNSDAGSSSSGPPPSSTKQSNLRVGEDCMVDRCLECGESFEEFSNDDLGMCIIILSTFVHRKPAMAAPLLPRMLNAVARVAGSELFTWQYSTGMHLPGSCTSIGGQFLRCVLHQLAPNQIFYQIFITRIDEKNQVKLFRTLAHVLLDFNELNSSAPVQLLLENLNERKELPTDVLTVALSNLACYMECVNQDGVATFSSNLCPLFDTFTRKLQFSFHLLEESNPIFRVIIAFFKIPGLSSVKNIVDVLAKLVTLGLRKSPIDPPIMVEVLALCARSFSRERERMARAVSSELLSVLKCKWTMPEQNIVMLLQVLLVDNGGTVGSNSILQLSKCVPESTPQGSLLITECVRAHHLQEITDLISDVHTLYKIKTEINQDTLGGLLKAGLAQYLALEISRSSRRDGRFVNKYLPWLNSPPASVQQGQKEFLDCVLHIRLLSWLLLGALMHSGLTTKTTENPQICLPVPPDASCHIADHLQVILSGFPEQSKTSVINMSSLFLAFILAQLWTVYLELQAGCPGSDGYSVSCALLMDFWAKVTPAILQLISHSKVESELLQLGEMVSLHLLSLLEALYECGSTMLTRLLPVWAPLMRSPHHTKLPDQLALRLQTCQDALPVLPMMLDEAALHGEQKPPLNSAPLASSPVLPNLLPWLRRLQFKMGQIELQSATASQFYSM